MRSRAGIEQSKAKRAKSLRRTRGKKQVNNRWQERVIGGIDDADEKYEGMRGSGLMQRRVKQD